MPVGEQRHIFQRSGRSLVLADDTTDVCMVAARLACGFCLGLMAPSPLGAVQSVVVGPFATLEASQVVAIESFGSRYGRLPLFPAPLRPGVIDWFDIAPLVQIPAVIEPEVWVLLVLEGLRAADRGEPMPAAVAALFRRLLLPPAEGGRDGRGIALIPGSPMPARPEPAPPHLIGVSYVPFKGGFARGPKVEGFMVKPRRQQEAGR